MWAVSIPTRPVFASKTWSVGNAASSARRGRVLLPPQGEDPTGQQAIRRIPLTNSVKSMSRWVDLRATLALVAIPMMRYWTAYLVEKRSKTFKNAQGGGKQGSEYRWLVQRVDRPGHANLRLCLVPGRQATPGETNYRVRKRRRGKRNLPGSSGNRQLHRR